MGEGEFVTDSALLNSIFGPKIHIVLTKDDISVGKRVYYSLSKYTFFFFDLWKAFCVVDHENVNQI